MTGAKRKPGELPAWPRLLSRDLAAAYLGISPNMLDSVPVAVVRIGVRKLYDRQSLDVWVDELGAHGHADGPQSWIDRITECGT